MQSSLRMKSASVLTAVAGIAGSAILLMGPLAASAWDGGSYVRSYSRLYESSYSRCYSPYFSPCYSPCGYGYGGYGYGGGYGGYDFNPYTAY